MHIYSHTAQYEQQVALLYSMLISLWRLLDDPARSKSAVAYQYSCRSLLLIYVQRVEVSDRARTYFRITILWYRTDLKNPFHCWDPLTPKSSDPYVQFETRPRVFCPRTKTSRSPFRFRRLSACCVCVSVWESSYVKNDVYLPSSNALLKVVLFSYFF